MSTLTLPNPELRLQPPHRHSDTTTFRPDSTTPQAQPGPPRRLDDARATEDQHATLVRLAMITRIRAELAAGTYETPERIATAAYRMLGDLS